MPAPAPRPAPPEQILAWVASITSEIARAPVTLRNARHLITELDRLPDQIDALTRALDRTTDTIDRVLPALSVTVDGVSETIAGAMTDRLEHLDTVVSTLGDTLTALIGSIPGARRALRPQAPRS